jgi:galactose mutarotase-like enzyme
MITIENDYLKVSIRNQGAEMTSFFSKENNTEHLWQANPEIWGWHAPNLFPVVGGCINDQVIVQGKSYSMQRHGFARQTDFAFIECTDTSAKFSLGHTAETLEVYPYRFSFQVIYDLEGPELRITYKVINYDNQTIHFSVGAHPAFNVPFSPDESLDNYYLEFENTEPLVTHLLSPGGFFSGENEFIPHEDNVLPITKELFAKDALVFKNLTSRKISIKSSKHPHSLYMRFPQFSYLGIWAKYGAPFICLEPWLGCADSEGKIVELADKEGVQSLAKGHVFEADFRIGIN